MGHTMKVSHEITLKFSPVEVEWLASALIAAYSSDDLDIKQTAFVEHLLEALGCEVEEEDDEEATVH